MDTEDHLRVRDLLLAGSGGWDRDAVLRYFGPLLADRVFAIPIPVHQSRDVLVWAQSCCSRAPSRLLAALFAPPPRRSLRATWIWKVAAHPRVLLFLWKVAWDRLPTRVLLAGRGIDLPLFCPVCGLEDESTEHALFTCSRARLIWSTFGHRPWGTTDGQCLEDFLAELRDSPALSAGRLAYLAYHIWLSRNSFLFEDHLISVQSLIRRAMAAAAEFLHVDSTIPSLGDPDFWDSHAASAAHPRVLSISWEPPPQGFVKVNFDDSVRGSDGGAGFVIRDSDGALLAAGGSHLFQSTVLTAELTAAWAGIHYAIYTLRADRIFLEGDSSTVISWIQGGSQSHSSHPLLRDLCSSSLRAATISARHIYREANTAADWVASYVAAHSGAWVWTASDSPSSLLYFVFLDSMGCARTRKV